MNKIITLRVSEKLKKELEEVSELLDMSITQLIITALQEYLTRTKEKMIRAGRIPKEFKKTGIEKKEQLKKDRIEKYIKTMFDEIITIDGKLTAVKYDGQKNSDGSPHICDRATLKQIEEMYKLGQIY